MRPIRTSLWKSNTNLTSFRKFQSRSSSLPRKQDPKLTPISMTLHFYFILRTKVRFLFETRKSFPIKVWKMFFSSTLVSLILIPCLRWKFSKMGCNINFPQVGGLLYLSDIEQHKLPSKSLLSSELKIKVALVYVAQLLQLFSLMSLQPLHPFRQLGRRALDYYCFIYMYHKPID